ncbi:MAG: hypothetical protein IT438_06770 [Phycisphaerales bacterium]|nr:hypothetical protein [Phycisphaerales bacterium]
MTALAPRSPRTRAFARVARLEANAAVRSAVDPREAAVRWTERFRRAHPELIQQVYDRAKTSPTILLDPTPDGRMAHAGKMWMFLMYEIPHLWVQDDTPEYGKLPPHPPVVPDPEVAATLFREFMITAALYQADHNDLFPLFGYRLQEIGKMAINHRREEALEARAAVEEGSASLWRLKRPTEKTPTEAGVIEGA